MILTYRLLVGDVRDTLQGLPAGSVQTCVTSPPFWGLRDYGTAQWVSGDATCDHVDPQGPVNAPSSKSTLTTNAGRGPLPGDKYQADRTAQFRNTCGKCGAQRIDSQIGLEPTPDAYVAQLVAVFREVRRVLKPSGTVFLNLGDSFGWPKPKDLAGIPWAVAFSLRSDGWYLRSDIIWSKPNPMPESVTDRPTKSHEYIFLLTKQPTYFYDSEAIKESAAESVVRRAAYMVGGKKFDESRNDSDMGERKSFADYVEGRNKRSVWHVATQPYPEAHFATFPEDLITPCILAGSAVGDTVLDPFCGSGTTGAVAVRHQRNFIGCELNPAYAELARKRIGSVAPLFSEERTA